MARRARVSRRDAIAVVADPTVPQAWLIVVGLVQAQAKRRPDVVLAVALALPMLLALSMLLAFLIPVPAPFLFPVFGRRGRNGVDDQARGYRGRRTQETAAVNLTGELPVERVKPVPVIHSNRLSS